MENYDFDTPRSKTALPSAAKQIILTLLVMGGIAFALWYFLGKGCNTPLVQTPPTTEQNPPKDDTKPSGETTEINIFGSNTLGKKLVPELIKAYFKQNGATSITDTQADRLQSLSANVKGETVKFTIQTTGTSLGFQNLNTYKADAVMASREVLPDEINALRTNFGDIRAAKVENVIAMDAVSVIVNSKSRVKDLSRNQLGEIFKGNITNWADLGYPSGEIALHIRDNRSATFDMFKETVLGGSNPVSSAVQYEDASELVSQVASDPNALGFVSWVAAKENANVRSIGIHDENTVTIPPSEPSIATEAYIFSRRLYVYAPSNGDAKKKKIFDQFLRFALSENGQKTAQRAGFVPLDPVTTGNTTTEISDKYRQAVRGGIRTNMVLRFKTGSSDLDAKALHDLERLKTDARYMGKSFILVGFTDNIGTEAANIALSQKRAQMVETEMKKRGLQVVSVGGLGSSDPVRDNTTELNRTYNRRVDVWFR